MRSMTGYGTAVAQSKDVTVEVSIRSVNGRYLEPRFHLPREFVALESDLKKILSQILLRGTVDVYVSRRVKNLAAKTKMVVNTEIAKSYMTAYRKLSKDLAPFWEKEALNARIFKRTQKMLAAGLVEEVRALLDEGLEDWAPLSSVGYREVIAAFHKGSLNLEDLLTEISQSTRQLAKRQRTWFRRDSEIHWHSGEVPMSVLSDQVEKFLNS